MDCDKCKRKGMSRRAYVRHMHTHSDRRVTCDHCGKTYASRDSLNGHLRKGHCAANRSSDIPQMSTDSTVNSDAINPQLTPNRSSMSVASIDFNTNDEMAGSTRDRLVQRSFFTAITANRFQNRSVQTDCSQISQMTARHVPSAARILNMGKSMLCSSQLVGAPQVVVQQADVTEQLFITTDSNESECDNLTDNETTTDETNETEEREHKPTGFEWISQIPNSINYTYLRYINIENVSYCYDVAYNICQQQEGLHTLINFKCDGLHRIEIKGESVQVLLKLKYTEWRAVQAVLELVKHFTYNSRAKEPNGSSLLARSLHYLFASTSKFSNVHIKRILYDKKENRVVCRLLYTTYKLKPKSKRSTIDLFVLDSVVFD